MFLLDLNLESSLVKIINALLDGSDTSRFTVSSCRKMVVLKIAVVCVWLYLSVHCQAEEYPQVTFMGNDLANHSYLNLSLVGTSDSDSVQCRTDVDTCCSNSQGYHRGDWSFPNGTVLPSSGDIYQRGHAQRVDLYRNSGSESGIYCCNITIRTGFGPMIGLFYIGLYQNGGDYS